MKVTLNRNVPCIETEVEGRRIHAWESTGLDVIGDVLCTTRRCVWCKERQHKGYGAGGRRSWTVTR